jgi:hypothetical protein
MGMMHPLHPLLYRYVPLHLAFPIEILLWFGVSLSGAYVLFRGWEVSRTAAFLGAFLFTFGGYSLLRMVHINGMAVFAHVPWLLVIAQHLAKESNYYRMAGWCVASALLTASQVLMGFPQHVVYSVMLEVGYLLVVAAGWQRLSRGVMLISAKMVAAVIGAVQILPTWIMLHQSTRVAPTLEFRALGSLHPYNLFQWVNPFVFADRHIGEFGLHELGIYPGVGTLLLFFWLCGQRPESEWHGRLRMFLIVTAAAGVFLALGKYNLVFPLYARLPVVALFRDPCRYFFFASFAFAGGAALALDRFIRTAGQTTKIDGLSYIVMVLSVGAAVVALTAHGSRRELFSSASHIVLGSVIVCACCVLFLLALRGGAFARVIFVLFLLGDVSFYYLSHLYKLPRAADPAFNMKPPPVAAPGPVYCVTDNNRLLFDGYRLVSGYVGLTQTSVLGFDSPEYRRLAGSRANQEPDGWEIVPDPIPRVRLTSGRAIIREDRPGRIGIEADATREAQVMLTERFDSGWTGRLDGNPIAPLRVNGDFLGVAVPAGHHEIDLKFDPADLHWGAKLSTLGLILLVLYPIFAYVAQRFRRRA